MSRPENLGETDPLRNEKGQVRAGHTLNRGGKGGRPKGLARLIRERTNNGEELVELALSVMRGECTVTRYDHEGGSYEVGPAPKERLDAAKWLAERAFGKVLDADPLAEDLGEDDEVSAKDARAIVEAVKRNGAPGSH